MRSYQNPLSFFRVECGLNTRSSSELATHPGNVLNVITDRTLPVEGTTGSGGYVDYFLADVVLYSDYYPYGMLMPDRNGSVGDYRYGFQGQEMDDEIKNKKGTSINYKFRMHDPRIGRFFAVDPLAAKFPHWSPYAFSGNIVISTVELEGLEVEQNPNKNEEPVKPVPAPWEFDPNLTPQNLLKQSLEKLENAPQNNPNSPTEPNQNINNNNPNEPPISDDLELPSMYNEFGYPADWVLEVTMADSYESNVIKKVEEFKDYILESGDPQLAIDQIALDRSVGEDPKLVDQFRGDGKYYKGSTFIVTSAMVDDRLISEENPFGIVEGTWRKTYLDRPMPMTSSAIRPGSPEPDLFKLDEHIGVMWNTTVVIDFDM